MSIKFRWKAMNQNNQMVDKSGEDESSKRNGMKRR